VGDVVLDWGRVRIHRIGVYYRRVLCIGWLILLVYPSVVWRMLVCCYYSLVLLGMVLVLVLLYNVVDDLVK